MVAAADTAASPTTGAARKSHTGAPAGTNAVFVLALPTVNPWLSSGSGFYFNLNQILLMNIGAVVGGGATFSLPVPNNAALAGFELATQAAVGPTKSTLPYGLDLLNAFHLTVGN